MVGSRPHLVHVFPTFDPYGAGIRTANLINHLGDRYRHTVAALDRRTGARDLIATGLDVGVIGPPEPGWLRHARFGRMLSWLRLLQPDLVLTYGFEALEAAVVNCWYPVAPQIHHEDASEDDEPSGRRWYRLQVRRLVLPRVARLVVPSPALQPVAGERWRLAPERVHVVPNGIDLGGYGTPHRPGAIPGLERSPGEVVVGTVAGMRRGERLERLIRGFAKAPHSEAARLVIVGDGPERGHLIRTVVEHGLEPRVVLPGHLAEPVRFLGSFDVFATSSRAEQVPFQVMEAMASGLPVIGTDIGDARAMVSEPNRDFIVDRANEAAYAAKLDALLRDGQLRIRLGRANREKALADFGFECMAAAYLQLYEEVLGTVPLAWRGEQVAGTDPARHLDA